MRRGIARIAELLEAGVNVCAGGSQRADSIQNALALVNDSVDMVAVHETYTGTQTGQMGPFPPSVMLNTTPPA